MKCTAEGQIIEMLSQRQGQGRDGKDWEAREYLLQEDDHYHYKMKFTMTSFDGPIFDAPSVGDRVRIAFDIQATEYKGKWYNNVRAYQIENLTKANKR